MNDKKGKSTSNQGQSKPRTLNESFRDGGRATEITRSLGPRQPTGSKPDNSDKGGGEKQGD